MSNIKNKVNSIINKIEKEKNEKLKNEKLKMLEEILEMYPFLEKDKDKILNKVIVDNVKPDNIYTIEELIKEVEPKEEFIFDRIMVEGIKLYTNDTGKVYDELMNVVGYLNGEEIILS